MAKHNPLNEIETIERRIIELLMNGYIDPQTAISLYRYSVKQVWTELKDSFDIFIWQFLYSRFSTHLLLVELKNISIMNGYREHKSKLDGESLEFLYEAYLKDLVESEDSSKILDDIQYLYFKNNYLNEKKERWFKERDLDHSQYTTDFWRVKMKNPTAASCGVSSLKV